LAFIVMGHDVSGVPIEKIPSRLSRAFDHADCQTGNGSGWAHRTLNDVSVKAVRSWESAAAPAQHRLSRVRRRCSMAFRADRMGHAGSEG
jgi:hypothetical protein